jgi:catechol 2,3-dioxygenase-like lactoylglutathione lyase family enzyme
MNTGYSHLGVATHDLDTTIRFYQDLLGFPKVAEHRYEIEGGGLMRMAYFDIGRDQFLVFMAPEGVRGIPTGFDTGINDGLGVPRGLYHLAFRADSIEALQSRQASLRQHGVEVSEIIDLGHARSIFFRDPNGLELECCCHLRSFGPDDLHRRENVNAAFGK